MHLVTPRLTLRPYSMDHLPVMNRWANDAELNYYDDDGPLPPEGIPLEATGDMLRGLVAAYDRSIIRFAIHNGNDDSCIGLCMIALIDRHNKRCNIGISIGEKDQWGLGYGREALRALVEHSFGALGMNRIGAEVYAYNERSLRLFSSIGFVREGLIRQAVCKRGEYADSVILGLLKSDHLAGPGTGCDKSPHSPSQKRRADTYA